MTVSTEREKNKVYSYVVGKEHYLKRQKVPH